MGDFRVGLAHRPELPAPEMARRLLARVRGTPRDTTPFDELHDVVLPDATRGDRHPENISDPPDALLLGCLDEVLVAVPARLQGGVGDQREDLFRTGRDLPTGAHNPGHVGTVRHEAN